MPSTMSEKRYMLIANPGAGRGTALSFALRAARLFKAKGCVLDLELTRGPGDAARIARETVRDHDVIIAVGGDGTVNELLPGIVFSGKPLAVIPAGSGNDFIKALGVPNRLEAAVDIALAGKVRTIDAGMINGRYFVNGVGIGFDAAVNKASYAVDRGKRGLSLYLRALVRTLGKFRPVPMTVTMNGNDLNQDVFLLSIGNGTTVGGGFKLTPRAVLNDGLLDVLLVKPIGLMPLLWHLPKVFLGTIDRVERYALPARTERLLVVTDPAVPAHIDGEVYEADGRFEISVVPHAVSVIGNWQ